MMPLPPMPLRQRGKLPAARCGMVGRIALAAFWAVALAACQRAPGPVAQPGKDRPTIVSLNPCTDAVLAEVTAPGQLLAISGYSHDPQSSSMDTAIAARYRSVSGAVEEVAALAPDVVVAGSFLPPTTVNALRDLGIRVELEPIVSDVAGARRQVRALAALSGDTAAGERLIARLDKALAASAAPPHWQPVPALVWESGGLVAGDDTLVVALLKHAGFTNSASARGLGQAEYLPLERVVADPPRVIFTAGNPLSEEDRMLHHPVLADMRDTMRIPLSRSLLWCAGPTVPRLLERLTDARRQWSQSMKVSGGRAPSGAGEAKRAR